MSKSPLYTRRIGPYFRRQSDSQLVSRHLKWAKPFYEEYICSEAALHSDVSSFCGWLYPVWLIIKPLLWPETILTCNPCQADSIYVVNILACSHLIPSESESACSVVTQITPVKVMTGASWHAWRVRYSPNSFTSQQRSFPLPSLPQTHSARHNSDTFFPFFLWGMVLRMRPDCIHCSLANGPVLRDWYSQSKVLIAFIFRQHAVKWSKAFLCLTLNLFPSLIGSWVGSSVNRRVGVWSPSAGRLSNCPQIASNAGSKGAKKRKRKKNGTACRNTVGHFGYQVPPLMHACSNVAEHSE